uniref:NADH-ubiquinone oxidoreductase chain 6 n=1 Tax=Cerambycidae sp. 8 KM-2017 TaxID=2219293 RepID=A0A346RGN0_9CUCU|nr:NADH dehydrogenase subunit 6 [Cerambycidae sp. 8 KM-2017]
MFSIALILILNSILFIFLNHPLSLGLILLFQTIFSSLIIGQMNLNYWFSYILFLVMIGGMLILFIYMTSIASNEQFNFSSKLLFMMLLGISMEIIFFMFDSTNFNFKILTTECLQFNSKINFSFLMNKIFSYPIFSNFLMIIIYLLISLIMVVKITDFHYGPLRQKK